MRRMARLASLALVPLAVTLSVALAAGCGTPADGGPTDGGTSTDGAPAGQGTAGSGPASAVADPAAPPQAAAMICAPEAAGEVAAGLGVVPVKVPASSWSDDLFTCRYEYADGTMVLSVKVLADTAATDAYFASARARVADPAVVPRLGEGAFTGPDGSVWVRKDAMVLRVDVSGLPATFGKPPLTRRAVAILVAQTILHCWTGDDGGTGS